MPNLLKGFECRLVGTGAVMVSSVLNRDVKQFGKKYLFDGNEETCWNSDQGSPQWVMIKFEKEETVETFHIQFQGGFVGKDCCIKAGCDPQTMEIVEPFYPEDINSLQTFTLKEPVKTKCLWFVFNGSTDFFGRIVIYKLEIFAPS